MTAVADAAKALVRLSDPSGRVDGLSALATSLLRSESAASFRIEDLAVSHKRLARVAFKRPDRPGDRAVEVLGSLEAMACAIELGASRKSIAIADLREVHRVLLRFSNDRKIAGLVREGRTGSAAMISTR